MIIKVLGPGCSNCKRLHKVTEEAIKEFNEDIKLEYITGIDDMMEHGVMSAPALVINDKIVSQGNKNLTKDDIIKMIEKDL